jgi:hypothetical protein
VIVAAHLGYGFVTATGFDRAQLGCAQQRR